ncbi:glycosyltransferase family 4 protein [Zymobacter palmae]|uniref:Glycosyltransferase n=1 Tax=Zymobacter palmae TaxID=33074 RepID=A0A348HB08_9GAMM|nr:glycosyltransferase family 4 protein [Zymobacter palmae]BBG28810.1 glycosyltransferase [Zymobacter palmae]
MSGKVLQLCLSKGAGGLEVYLARIITGLQQQGWTVYGVALEGTRVAEYMHAAGIRYRARKSQARALMSVRSIVRWMRLEGIDVIHCHKSSDLRLAALIKCFLPRTKLIYTDHVGSKREKKDLFHRWAYGKVDRVLSISDETRERNVKALPLPADRITRLHHGIEIDQFPPLASIEARHALLKELDLPTDRATICLPARVAEGKGHDVWVEALAQLPDDLPWHGVILGGTVWSQGGDEDYVERIEALIERLGLASRITFTGHRSDIRRLLPAFDVLCIPSRNEAFGLTVIESMAAGRPVVGSNSGAIPELLAEDSGLLATYDDPASWAAQLTRLLKDESLQETLGRRGRERVEAHFSQQQHVAKLIQLYTDPTHVGPVL